jgi:hypothetical protein
VEVVMPSLAECSRRRRRSVSPARAKSISEHLARVAKYARTESLEERLFKDADQFRCGYSIQRWTTKLSEHHDFLRRMAIVRAWAAVRLARRDDGGNFWRQQARLALRDARMHGAAARGARAEGR